MRFFTEPERLEFTDWHVYVRDEDLNERYRIDVGEAKRGETLRLIQIVDEEGDELLSDGRATNVPSPITPEKAALAAATWVRNTEGWTWANESEFQ